MSFIIHLRWLCDEIQISQRLTAPFTIDVSLFPWEILAASESIYHYIIRPILFFALHRTLVDRRYEIQAYWRSLRKACKRRMLECALLPYDSSFFGDPIKIIIIRLWSVDDCQSFALVSKKQCRRMACWMLRKQFKTYFVRTWLWWAYWATPARHCGAAFLLTKWS